MNTPADKPDLPPIPHASLYSSREQMDLIEWATGIVDAARADERRKALEEAAQRCITRADNCDDNAAHTACLNCARAIRALIDRKEPT